jgi:two-component system, response regulator
MAETEAARTDMRRTRILIVEDNPDDEALLLRQLKKAQLDQHVMVIADGKVAVEYLNGGAAHDEQIIALFLDLNLPKISGLHILEQVRANERTRALPVIVMTSSNSPQDLERCHQLGVSCYVQKPITFATFSKAIADSFHSARVITDTTSLRMSGVE